MISAGAFFRPLAVLAVLAHLLCAEVDAWETDFEKARRQAAAEGKDLLVSFTGSDWCGFCIQLSEDVFSTPEFRRVAPELFVLVEIDFPREPPGLSEELARQNAALAKKYGVEEYPTLILMDEKGRPYARTGYRPGGANHYLAHLKDLRQIRMARDEALAAAETLEGVEKASALAGALEPLPEIDLVPFYGEIAAAIAEADPDDESGFQRTREYRRAFEELYRKAGALVGAGDPEAALEEIDAFLAKYDPQGSERQKILMGKVTLYMENDDPAAALALLDEIKNLAPQSDLGRQVERTKAEISAYLNQEGSSEEGSSE